MSLDEDRGIFAFARIAGLPSDRNLIDFYLEGGLNFAGLVPGRPSDVFGFAVSYSRISEMPRHSIETMDSVGCPHQFETTKFWQN